MNMPSLLNQAQVMEQNMAQINKVEGVVREEWTKVMLKVNV